MPSNGKILKAGEKRPIINKWSGAISLTIFFKAACGCWEAYHIFVWALNPIH